MIDQAESPLESGPPDAQDNQWELTPGQLIRRVDLHAKYGGGGQGGISPSSQSLNVLIFTDLTAGSQHGYVYYGWQEGRYETFQYTGEGQRGED